MVPVKGGSKNAQARADLKIKHQTLGAALILMRSTEMKALDTVLTCEPFGPTSCRKLILDLTWPLVPTGNDNEKVSKLFHSVDFAASGRTAGCEVFFTAFKDRAEIAEQLVAVLPQFLDFITVSRNQEASALWCVNPAEPLETSDIEWEQNEKGE